MRSLSLLLIASALAACTTAPEPVTRSAEAEAHLQKLLAGKSAGPAVNCLTTWQSDDMVVIDDGTILFRNGGRRVYRNNLRADCSRLGTGFYTLVTKRTGGGLCSGDIAQVVDLNSGMTVSSCVLGEFVPYTKVG